MLKFERQAKILQLLESRGFAASEDLAKEFNVSLVTIRRDFKSLLKQNLIKLEHGGATDVDYSVSGKEPLYNTKVFMNKEKKQAIGDAAVKFIKEGEVIILDSGTTSFEVARNICKARFKDLTVITNDLMVAKELCQDNSNLQVIMLGGVVRMSYYSVYGPYTEMILKLLKVNKYFMGADAISATHGIFNSILNEVPIKQQMISISDQVIMVADSSKFCKEAPHKVCDLKDINMVISDEYLPESYFELFKSLEITLLVAKEKEL
ncbi:MAG: DeoR/GlpR family DNA-binding transcription regulator [Candidatus Humimicrobiaceae bacterium]